MGSLVKLATPIRLRQQLSLELEEELEVKSTPSYLGIEVVGNIVPERLSGAHGKSEPTEDPDKVTGLLEARRRYRVALGTLRPMKYHALVEVNPALYGSATVGCAKILEPGECVDLEYYIQPFRNIDLTKLDWHVRIYLLD